MLLEATYKEGDTISFKTVAGEEVIARLIKKEKDSMRVKKPMALTMTKEGIGMVPFTFTVGRDSELDVNLATIVFIAKTEKGMADQYIESTTGIKMNQEVIKMSEHTIHEQIVSMYETYIAENEKFEGGTKASAARARKALGEMGKLAKAKRAEIQEKKNNM